MINFEHGKRQSLKTTASSSIERNTLRSQKEHVTSQRRLLPQLNLSSIYNVESLTPAAQWTQQSPLYWHRDAATRGTVPLAPVAVGSHTTSSWPRGRSGHQWSTSLYSPRTAAGKGMKCLNDNGSGISWHSTLISWSDACFICGKQGYKQVVNTH